MGVSLVIDDATLLLMLLIILALVFTIYTARSFQPLLHPLILTRQADVARVRHHGESAVFRNANSPPGFELAGRPRRGAESVGKMLELGSATSAVTGSFGAGRTPNEAGDVQFTLFGESSSTTSLMASARRFTSGLQSLTASKELCLVVCSDRDSVAASTALLAPAVSSSVSLQVVPPSTIHAAREALPSAAKLRAVFTSAEHLEQVLGWKLLTADVLICLPSNDELLWAKAVAGSEAYKLVSAEQVLEAGSEAVDAQSATLDSLYAHYWSDAWVPISHGSLTAGVTAHLGAFSADKIPTRNDRISVRCPPVGLSAVKDLLSPVSTPAGLAILLLACYTGASLSFGVDSDATMLYTSPLLAAELADSLAALSGKAPLSLGLYATRSKLYALRQGVLANDSFWDRIHFNRIREEAGVKQLRSISVIDESGRQVGQNTIDTLRAFTGGTVMHAYLPSVARTEDSHAVALFTAPISSSHAADLQAFDDGENAPYHVGPPSVSVEMKLLETPESKRKGYSVETVSKGSEIDQSLSRWPRDPAGTLYVRGKTVATKETQGWATPYAIAAFRTNGTLVLVDSPEATEVIQTDALGSARSRASKGKSHLSTAARAAALSVVILSLVGQVSAAGGAPNGTMIDVARAGLLSAQRPSWVQGAAAAAFIELDASSNWNYFSGVNNGPVYRPANFKPSADGLPRDVSNMAYHAIAAQDGTGRLCSRITGEESLGDSSSLDSSSCAVQVLLTGVSTGQIAPNRVGSGFYADAAARQLSFVLERTNRTRAGAISQRNSDLQIWSDSLYMISSLAVYGLVYNNQTLLQEAYNQLSLYRQVLLQPSGRYSHIWDATNSTWLDGAEWVSARLTLMSDSD